MGRQLNTNDPLGLDSMLTERKKNINPDDPLGLEGLLMERKRGAYPVLGSTEFMNKLITPDSRQNSMLESVSKGSTSLIDAAKDRDIADKSMSDTQKALEFVTNDFKSSNSSNTLAFPSFIPASQVKPQTGIPFVEQPGTPAFQENAAKTLISSSEQLKDYLYKRSADIDGQIKDLTSQIKEIGDNANIEEEHMAKLQLPIVNKMADLAEHLKALKNAQNILVAPMVAKELIAKNGNKMPDPITIGREIIRYGDPNYNKQLETLENAGSAIPPGRVYDMASYGIQAAKKYLVENPTAPNREVNMKVLDQQEQELQSSNNAYAVQTVNDKLGSYFLKNGNSGFFGRSTEDIRNAINDPAAGLNDREKQIAEKYVIPNKGYNIPSSGFWVSTAKGIQRNTVNTLNTVRDIFGSRGDVEKTFENLNTELDTHYANVGENPQGVSELQYLRSKKDLTPEEGKRKNQLENYVDVRGKWDKFKDGSGDFVGFATVMAIEAQALGATGRLLSAGSVPIDAGIGNFLSRPAVGNFVTSSAMMYDDFSKQSLQLMPGKENEGARAAYSFFMTGIAGTAGHIIGAPKVLGQFLKGVQPEIQTLAKDLTEGEISKAAAKVKLQEIVLPFLKGTVKQSAETGAALSLITASQAMANSVFGGEDFDMKKTANDAIHSFFTGALYSAPLSALAGVNAVNGIRSWNKASVFDMSSNPGAYERAAHDLHEKGDITQEQLNEKLKIINTAAKINAELPKVYPDGMDGAKIEQAKKIQNITLDERGDAATKSVAQTKLDAFLQEHGISADELQDIHPKDLPEKTSYLLHRLNEELLNEKIDKTTDEVLKKDLERQRDRSKAIREGIFKGDIAVTSDYRDVAPDKETADKLGLLPWTEVPQEELSGTKYENPEHEYNLPVSANPEKALEVLNNDLKNIDESIEIAKENNVDTAALEQRKVNIGLQIDEVKKKITASDKPAVTLTNPLNSDTNIDKNSSQNSNTDATKISQAVPNQNLPEQGGGQEHQGTDESQQVQTQVQTAKLQTDNSNSDLGGEGEIKFGINDTVNFLNRPHTIENIIKVGNEDKYLLKDAKGKEIWTNLDGLKKHNTPDVKPDPALSFAGTPSTPEEIANTAKVGKEVKEKFHAAPKVVGGPVTRTLPDGTKIKGRFIVTTADAVTPSHNPITYESSKGFPTLPGGENPNDRDYKLPVNQGAVVSMGNDFGDEALNDVPVVDRNGVVLDGNNRTMSGQIAATQGTDTRYNEALQEQAYRFGLTPEQVADVAKSGSPRVYFLPEGELPYNTNTFARFNKNVQKEKSPMARAIELGRTVPANVLSTLSNILDGHDAIGDFYKDSKDVRKLFDTLVTNKVLTEFEIPKYFNRETGTIENAGKDFLETLMLGNVVGEKELSVLNNEGVKSYRQKIIRALKPLAEIKSFGDAFQIQDFMNEAIRMKDEMVKKDMDLDTYLKSPKLFDAPPTVEGVTMLIAMEENDKIGNKNNPAAFKNFVTKYANEARNASTGAVSLFDGGAVTQDDILNLLIENYFKNEQKQQAIQTARQTNQGEGANTDIGNASTEIPDRGLPAESQRQPRAEQTNPAEESLTDIREQAIDELANMDLPFFLRGVPPDEVLKYVADQALNRTATGEMAATGDSRAGIERIVGKSIVEKAIQLYPLQTKITDNGNQTESNNGPRLESPTNNQGEQSPAGQTQPGEPQSDQGTQQNEAPLTIPDNKLTFERNPNNIQDLRRDIDDMFSMVGEDEVPYRVTTEPSDYDTSRYALKTDYGSVSGGISPRTFDVKNNFAPIGESEISIARIDAKEIGKGQGLQLVKDVIDYARKNNIKNIGSASLNDFSRKTFETLEEQGYISPFLKGMNDKTITWKINPPPPKTVLIEGIEKVIPPQPKDPSKILTYTLGQNADGVYVVLRESPINNPNDDGQIVSQEKFSTFGIADQFTKAVEQNGGRNLYEVRANPRQALSARRGNIDTNGNSAGSVLGNTSESQQYPQAAEGGEQITVGEENVNYSAAPSYTELVSKLIQAGNYKFEDIAAIAASKGKAAIIPQLATAYKNIRDKFPLSIEIKNSLDHDKEIERITTDTANGTGPATAGVAQQPGESIQGGPADNGAVRGTLGSRRPPIRIADQENLPEPRTDYATVGMYDIDEHQRLAVNLMANRFIGDEFPGIGAESNKGFLLADGAGVGKTREILAIADLMKKYYANTERGVLLIAPSGPLKDSYVNDSKAMKIPLSNFETGTYNDLVAGKIGKKKYGLVVFDESHNLKNVLSQRAIAASKIDGDHFVYASATPMDKPEHAVYFISQITDRTPEQVQNELGIDVRYFPDRNTGELVAVAHLRNGIENYIQNLLTLRSQAVKNGAMIRREYPFYGDIKEKEFDMPAALSKEIGEVTTIHEARIDNASTLTLAAMAREIEQNGKINGLNEYVADLKSYIRGKGAYALLEKDFNEQTGLYPVIQRRIDEFKKKERFMMLQNIHKANEGAKFPEALAYVKEQLAQGKQAIVVGKYVNKHTIEAGTTSVKHGPSKYGFYKREIPAEETLLRKLKAALEAEGIKVATIFGGNKNESYEKERDLFQTGTAPVLLMTSKSGGTGINLDDVVGNKPRGVFIATADYAGDIIEQTLGRVSRRNTASPAEVVTAYYRNNAADNSLRSKGRAKLAVLKGITTGESDLDRERIASQMQEKEPLEKPFNPNPAVVATPKEKGIKYVSLSEKAFMVQGDTFPVKDKIKALGAKWLQARKGWMFPTSRMEEVKGALDKAYAEIKGTGENEVSETPISYNTVLDGDNVGYQSSIVEDSYAPAVQGNLFEVPGEAPKEINTVRAVWTRDKNLQFTGSTRVEGHADVAHIMRLLETKSVEHAFAVHIDKSGNSHIQFMSVGGTDGTVIDPRVLLQGIDRFKSAKVYLVHNHPSGNLQPSNADIAVTQRIIDGIAGLGIELEHVIMDGLKAEYTVLTKNDIPATYTRDTTGQPDIPLTAHQLNDVEILSKPFGTLKDTGVEGAVSTIQQLRFSALPKRAMLVLNNSNDVLANYILPDISTDEVVKLIGKTPTGTGVIFYGNEDYHTMIGKANKIGPTLKGMTVRIVDVLKVNPGPDVTLAYRSAYAENELNVARDIQEKYGTGDMVNDSGSPMDDNLKAFADESADMIINGDSTLDEVIDQVRGRLTPEEQDALVRHILGRISAATGAGAKATGGGAGMGGGAGVNPPTGAPQAPPVETEPSQEKMIELTRAERMRKVYQDRRVALNKTQDEIIEKLQAAGAKLNDSQKAYDAYTLMKSKTAHATNVIRSWFNRNPKDSFIKRLHAETKDKLPTTNEALAALSDYVVAVSSLERNEAVRNITTERQQRKIAEVTARLASDIPKAEKQKLVTYLDKLIKNQVEGLRIIPDGGSGMMNEMANTIIADAQIKGLGDTFDKFHDDFRENIITPILEKKLSYGLISAETYDKLNKYKFYLPMKIDSTEFGPDFSYSTPVGSKVDADVYGIKGSVKERANPFFQGMVDLEYTIMQGELNIAHQALSNLLQLEPGLGETTDRIRTIGNKIVEPDVQFFIDGDKRYIYIKDDELKDAIVGSKRWRNNKELAQKHFYDNGIGKTYQRVFNLLAAVRTSYSPKFALKQAFSDFGQSLINAAQVAPEVATEIQARAIKWQSKITLQGLKRVFVAGPMIDYERHLQVNQEAGATYRQIQEYLKRMSEAGGRLQWSSQFSKAKSIEDAIHEEIKKKSGVMGWTKSMLNNVNAYIKLMSDVNENRARLSVFISAVEQKDAAGNSMFSDQDAARIAREISIDFEKEGDVTPYMRHVYMFSNARIQSVRRDWITMFTKRGMKVAAGLFVMGYLMNELNGMLSDCEGGHEDCADDISSYEKNGYFIMKNLAGRGFIKIPMPRFMGVFYASGTNLSDYLNQKTDGHSFIKRELAASNEIQPSPINVPGSGGTMRSAVPTMFQLPLELYINEDFAGNPIHPKDNPYKPMPPAPFIAMNNTPEPYKNFAQWLFKITGGYEANNPLNSFVKNSVYPDNIEHVAKNFLGGVYSVGQDATKTVGAAIDNGPSGLVDPNSLPANRMLLLNTLFTEGTPWNDVSNFWDTKEASARQKFDKAEMARFEDLANRLRRSGDLDAKTVDKAKTEVRKNQQKIDKNE